MRCRFEVDMARHGTTRHNSNMYLLAIGVVNIAPPSNTVGSSVLRHWQLATVARIQIKQMRKRVDYSMMTMHEGLRVSA